MNIENRGATTTKEKVKKENKTVSIPIGDRGDGVERGGKRMEDSEEEEDGGDDDDGDDGVLNVVVRNLCSGERGLMVGRNRGSRK